MTPLASRKPEGGVSPVNAATARFPRGVLLLDSMRRDGESRIASTRSIFVNPPGWSLSQQGKPQPSATRGGGRLNIDIGGVAGDTLSPPDVSHQRILSTRIRAARNCGVGALRTYGLRDLLAWTAAILTSGLHPMLATMSVPLSPPEDPQKIGTGRPVFVVSSVGQATLGPNVPPNNGADFGPDSAEGKTTTVGINEALAALAPTLGGKILILRGAYAPTAPISWAVPNVELEFQEGVTITTSAANAVSPSGGAAHFVWRGNGVTLRGFTNAGFNLFEPAHFVIEGSTLIGLSPPKANNSAVFINGGSFGILRDLTFTDCGNATAPQAALKITSNVAGVPSHDIDVVNCHAAGGPGTASTFTIGSSVNAPGPNDILYRIRIMSCKATGAGPGRDGFDVVNHCRYVLLSDCQSTSPNRNGFAVGNLNPAATCMDITLVNCVSLKSGGAGFALGQAIGSESNIVAVNCTSIDSNQNRNSFRPAQAGFVALAPDCLMSGCTARDGGTGAQLFGLFETAQAARNTFVNCNLAGNVSGPVGASMPTSRYRNCTGFNDQG
jgi:hypothetical protein